jgi:hypothetical protein
MAMMTKQHVHAKRESQIRIKTPILSWYNLKMSSSE